MKREKILNDYEGFLEKHKPKKTTDDCYTPAKVYNTVLDYVIDEYKIDKNKVVRPFYPCGDYENFDYSERKIVVDNPPFSIFSKIVNFYIEHDIKFFLFAPHLTLFSANCNACHIVVGATIEYENKAKIVTSFITNLDDKKIKTAPKLYKNLTELNKKNSMPKYEYPDNLITSSKLTKLNKEGIDFYIDKEDVHYTRSLDSQKEYKKTIFGAGYLISNKKTKELNNILGNIQNNIQNWELSEREKTIIEKLGQ